MCVCDWEIFLKVHWGWGEMLANIFVCLQEERGRTLQLGIERNKIRLKIHPNFKYETDSKDIDEQIEFSNESESKGIKEK